MSDRNFKSIPFFLGGLAGGICLSLFLGFAALYSSAMPASQRDAVSVENNALLDEAELALNSGEPERVRELLYPAIDYWTSREALIRGYRLLGEAELAQGHAQMAVPHFEKLYLHENTPGNLFKLATTLDLGGDIRKALQRYQELASREDIPPDIDMKFVNARIEDINRTLGTPVPTQTP